jgi:WD40 repeat protein
VFWGLIRGELSNAEEAELGAHLDGCVACCLTLEELTAMKVPLQRPVANEHLLRVVSALQAELGGRTWDAPPGAIAAGGLADPHEVPGTHLGRYEVREVIGRGGMGVVLKAFDPTLNRFVAIKVLAAHLASSMAARRRFAREARATAAVSDENVVAIHGVEEADGQPYLVMEYVPGISLQEKLDRCGALELEEVLRIGRQVASGLAAAHAQGLVHRDVKPGNVLLEHSVERVKITDFGLAQAIDDARLTQSGVVTGTPAYMAPEQARGEALDHRADLFSLGSLLYVLCTGRLPFRAGSALAVLKRICEDTPRPVREINPSVPAWLEQLIAALHVKDPARRLDSAGEVARLLERCLAHLQHPGAYAIPDCLYPRKRWGPWRSALAAGGLLLAGAALYHAWPMLRWGGRPPAVAPEGSPGTGQRVRLRGALDHPGGPVLALSWAPGGEVLATACHDRTVHLWELTPARRRAALPGHRERVWGVAFTPNGQMLASCGGNWDTPQASGELSLWDATTGKLLSALGGRQALVFAVAFSLNGRLLASAGFDGLVRLWDVAKRRQYAVLSRHRGPVRALCYSPDGKWLASAGFDGTVQLWEAGTGKYRHTLRRRGCSLNAVAFSPDSRTLAVAENPLRPSAEREPGAQPEPVRPGRVRLWDVATQEDQGELGEYRGQVLSLAYSPDGETLVTGGGYLGEFGELVLWDMRQRARQVTLHGHRAWVESVAFSADGGTLVSAGGAPGRPGEVRVWEVRGSRPWR